MAEELKQINLETTASADPPPLKPKLILPKVGKILPGVLVVLVIFLVLGLLAFRGVIVQAQATLGKGRELAAAVKNQDLQKTKESLLATRQSLVVLDKEFNKVRPFKYLPILGAYVRDGEHAIAAAFAGLTAGDKAIEALEPNADLLGLKGKSSFVSGTADERLQTAVKTMNALVPKINEMAGYVDTLRIELAAINPNRYPKKLGKTKLREQLAGAKDVIESTANLFVNAQPLLINLPLMLGEPQDKRYLILFQNDKELRPTGGFITAYAQFRFSHGKPILERADDIYALDSAKRKTFPAPPEILKFHKGVYVLNLRDSNLSPDFKLSMQKFEEIYDSVAGKEKIDGIIAVDTHVLVEALRILGPLTIAGRTFSAEIDKRCDCPRAVYELEDYSTRPVGYVRTARKDIIGVLFQSMLQMALGVSPSKYWGSLFQMLIAEINEKHILAYFHDAPAEKAAESFNMAGRIMAATDTATLLSYAEDKGWDYLHLNQSNMAGAKANMFVSEKVSKDVTVNGDGTLTTKLTVDYKNPYPGSDCGLESGGLCLNAPLRDWVRVYTPLGSKLVDSKGAQSPKDAKPVPMDTYENLGKTVFEGFLVVNPLGTARLELTYTSPVKLEGGKYRLLLQKQPGTSGQEWTLKLNGKEKKKFDLARDTELVF